MRSAVKEKEKQGNLVFDKETGGTIYC